MGIFNKWKNMKKNVFLFFPIIIWILIYLYSLSLEPFKDISKIDDARVSYYDKFENRQEASNKYFKIYNDQLTNKFRIQNYSFWIIILFSSILLFIKFLTSNNYIRTPKKWIVILFIGFIATIITSLSFIFALFLEYNRLKYPPWADSLGISILGIFPLFIFWILISFFYYLLISRNYNNENYRLFDSKYSFKIIWLFLLVPPIIISIFISIYSFIIEDFLFIIPFELWGMFFTYILLWKKLTKK